MAYVAVDQAPAYAAHAPLNGAPHEDGLHVMGPLTNVRIVYGEAAPCPAGGGAVPLTGQTWPR